MDRIAPFDGVPGTVSKPGRGGQRPDTAVPPVAASKKFLQVG
jgi:hypothetical protein